MTSPITLHLRKRMAERFGIKLNRKARLELVEWIEKQNWSRLRAVKTWHPHRYVINVPLFMCKTLRESNKDVKWGSRAVVVYDNKLHRIITAWTEKVEDKDGKN